jgi:hypothetical protein
MINQSVITVSALPPCPPNKSKYSMRKLQNNNDPFHGNLVMKLTPMQITELCHRKLQIVEHVPNCKN